MKEANHTNYIIYYIISINSSAAAEARRRALSPTGGRGRDQGGVFRYFGRQIGCLVVRGYVSDGLPVSAGQNEAATPGQLFSLRR